MKDSRLSMSRFKLENGELKSFDSLNQEEKIAYTLAQGMKEIIEILEGSTPNERMFQRAKFNTMSIFHRIFDKINDLKEGKYE